MPFNSTRCIRNLKIAREEILDGKTFNSTRCIRNLQFFSYPEKDIDSPAFQLHTVH